MALGGFFFDVESFLASTSVQRMSLLAQRPIWRIADLGDQTGLVGSMLHGLITRLKQDALIVSVGYGKVSLRTRAETAA